MRLPLAGITVVAVEQAVAVPFATRQLADLGARVIKIERPVSGDFARSYDTTVRGMSSHFVWLNRGVSLEAMRIMGGNGFSKDFPVERYYRDAPLLVIGGGTNELQRLIIARQLLQKYAI